MSFGPFKLVNVRISYDNLVLDLANDDGEILYSPKRKLRYGQSDEAKRLAEDLSLVPGEVLYRFNPFYFQTQRNPPQIQVEEKLYYEPCAICLLYTSPSPRDS